MTDIPEDAPLACQMQGQGPCAGEVRRYPDSNEDMGAFEHVACERHIRVIDGEEPAEPDAEMVADMDAVEHYLSQCEAYHTSCKHPSGRTPVDLARAMLAELRRLRALLADLKAEGCPMADGDPGPACAYCGGGMIDARDWGSTAGPRYDHRPMEDGKPCLWVRIQGT